MVSPCVNFICKFSLVKSLGLWLFDYVIPLSRDEFLNYFKNSCALNQIQMKNKYLSVLFIAEVLAK